MKDVNLTWHAWPLRVRYQETDQMGVVYHMNYLNWFEIGRTEAIRALGVAYRDLEAEGLYLPLTDAQMVFKRAARYDDEVVVYTKVAEFGPLRIRFDSEARKVEASFWHSLSSSLEQKNTPWFAEPQGELLVSGSTGHVWLNRDWYPARLDHAHPALYGLLKRL
jgi:acyl-CoA thioester hydrolase